LDCDPYLFKAAKFENHCWKYQRHMNPRLPIAAITDEFSPSLAEAMLPMKEIGMSGAELRVIDGKNIIDLSNDELKRAKEILDRANMQVISIASPLLKCVLEDGPEVDARFQQDVFAAKHTFADQPRLIERAFEIARFFEAPIVRVFSYWRTVEPEQCYEPVARALSDLAQIARGEKVVIGLENEHACNVATGAEAAKLLQLIPETDVMVVWDPANALVAGEVPFPDGYTQLPKGRVAHVHAKDCDVSNGKPAWGPLGTRHVAWKRQIAKLLEDGYRGYLSLETHWPGPGGDKMEASRICGWNLRGLAAA
jgi:L-ribulose-5-phosphate 3-epimerase